MANLARTQILVVDDDLLVLERIGWELGVAGYEVGLAENGLDALAHLRKASPLAIIADVNTPQISGFDFLSVVRRWFPHILIVAMSGRQHSEDAPPCGLFADVFYDKARNTPGELLKIVADLILRSTAKAISPQQEWGAVWTPQINDDSTCIPYVTVTCAECLRSFPLSVEGADLEKCYEIPCLFCPSTIRCLIDLSGSLAAPPNGMRITAIAHGPAKAAARA
ncbi:MAG TPA: response regulator [Candidatus Saccharimonadales bacterium]|jgi:CheY-like chemotaxis protein|nr:response regulator [Candidatus Saccharimonadales bacterium]